MAPVFAIFPLATELMTPLAKAPAFGQGGIEGLPADGMAALPGGGRRGSLREFPAHDTRQAAGEGSIPAVVSRRASASASGRTEALAGYSFGGHAYAAHRHHGFAQHAAPGMPDVYPQAAHKAVHLLRDFQERDGAEKPNEDVPGNGGAASAAICCRTSSSVRAEAGTAARPDNSKTKTDMLIKREILFIHMTLPFC